MTSSVIGPRRSLKVFSKTKLAPKKVTITIWWSAATVIHYSFLNPSETITSEKYAQQMDEMHWKLQRLQSVLVNRRGPMLLHDDTWPYVTQPMLYKLKELGFKVLLHLPYSPNLSPTHYHFFKHLDNFLQGNHFQSPGGRKCFPRVCQILNHRLLCSRSKQTYFLLEKMCWLEWFHFN